MPPYRYRPRLTRHSEGVPMDANYLNFRPSIPARQAIQRYLDRPITEDRISRPYGGSILQRRIWDDETNTLYTNFDECDRVIAFYNKPVIDAEMELNRHEEYILQRSNECHVADKLFDKHYMLLINKRRAALQQRLWRLKNSRTYICPPVGRPVTWLRSRQYVPDADDDKPPGGWLNQNPFLPEDEIDLT